MIALKLPQSESVNSQRKSNTVERFSSKKMSEGPPGSKPRSGWTRDVGCKKELFADDNELANFHPQTARLQLPGGPNRLRSSAWVRG